MSILYKSLRIAIQLLLLWMYGRYLEDVLSLPFLFGAFFVSVLLTGFLFRKGFRTLPALILIGLYPWLVRILIILVQQVDRSFLQISFDMSFYFTLLPLYLAALSLWFTLRYPRFRPYEVLLNGLYLWLLFLPQGNYRVSLVPDPAWLALIAVAFLVMTLLQLYTAEERTRGQFVRELLPFMILLVPLVVYLLYPLWKDYEEGSVAGGGGLLKSSLFRFDFSEYITLETEISMSDDLVLMYRKEGPAERMLLRRYVLSGYEEGQGFYRHDRDKENPPDKVPPRYEEYVREDLRNREAVSQELFLVNIDPTAFLSLNYPVDVQPIYNWDDSSFVRIYKSRAMVNTIPLRDPDPPTEMAEEDFKHYTFSGENEIIEQLAEEVAGNVPGKFLKVLAIEEHLRENYYYSLKPGVAIDGDQLSWFLSESRKGYCSYFAFSMALICRKLGIPARVAVGFWVDPEVSVLNFYPVRADQAHAWVEVYFKGYGWLEFDPTSSTMFPGEQYPFAGFAIDEFSPLIEEILDQELIEENLPLSEQELQQKEDRERITEKLYDIVSRIWIFILLALWGIYILFRHYIYALLFLFRSQPRKKASALYRNLRVKVSFERKLFRESLSEYAERLEELYRIPFREVTSLYQKSLFAPRFTKEDLNAMEDEAKNSFKAYRQNVSPIRRFLHFLFPFVRSAHL